MDSSSELSRVRNFEPVFLSTKNVKKTAPFNSQRAANSAPHQYGNNEVNIIINTVSFS